jgi:fibronectin type 3 domain-containing protein
MQKPNPSGARRVVSFEGLESRLVLSAPVPTGLDASLVAPRGVHVQWNDVVGETGYLVERRVDGTTEPWTAVGDPGADVTHFEQDGLTPGKTYLYRVRSRSESGNSEPSNVDFVTVPGEPTVPAAPHLEAFLAAAHAAKLEWTNVANETGYQIERRVDGSADPFAPIATRDADANSYVDDGLTAGKTYIYRVRAVNAAGNSAWSNNAAVVVPGDGVPDAPRELVAEVVQGTFVRLRWVDVSGEKGYRVERRLDAAGTEWVQIGNTAENVVTFADQNVEKGKRYAYRVRAFNDAGNSPYSNVAAVTVFGPEPGVPAAPRELNAELTDAGKVKLTWNDVDNEAGYKVERRVDGTDAWTQIGTTGANVLTFLDGNVDKGKTYIYRVRAFNDAGNSSYSNTDAVRIPGDPTTPLAPHLEVDLVGPRAAKLTWTDVTGESIYRIERRVDGSAEGFKEIRTVNAGVTTITDDGLEPGKTYLYRVRAANAAGNGPYSNVAAVRVPLAGLPTAPRELRATAVSPTRVDLKWADATLETGYRIERRLAGTDTWAKVGQAAANATSFSDTHALAGKTYQYRVRAFNDVGSSPWSNVAVATTPGDGATAPAAPRELTAELTDARRVRLHWADVAGEQGYKVERRVDGTDGWTQIGTTGENVTTFLDENVVAGKTYLYRVRAFNAAGNSDYSNVRAVSVPSVVTRPAAPRDLVAKAISPTRVDLKWIGVDGERGYRIERRLAGTDAWGKVAFVVADVTSYSDTTAEAGKTYQYRVRAAGETEPSAWSNVATATTPA